MKKCVYILLFCFSVFNLQSQETLQRQFIIKLPSYTSQTPLFYEGKCLASIVDDKIIIDVLSLELEITNEIMANSFEFSKMNVCFVKKDGEKTDCPVESEYFYFNENNILENNKLQISKVPFSLTQEENPYELEDAKLIINIYGSSGGLIKLHSEITI